MESHKVLLQKAQNRYNFCPLLQKHDHEIQSPLVSQDSVNSAPNYSLCTLGLLTAQGKWGTKKGIAFIIDDNYLLTCASNCYSHQHGEYPNINFTINSNKKLGQDVHKVAKVFIPQQFKKLSQKKRRQYDYALIHIQSGFSLSEQYGNIGIRTDQDFQGVFTYVNCYLSHEGQLEFIGEQFLGDKPQICLSGSPIISQQTSQDQKAIQAVGLIVQQSSDKKPYLLKFTQNSKSQLQSWVSQQIRRFYFSKSKNNLDGLQQSEFNATNMEVLERKPVQQLCFSKCKFNQLLHTSFIQKLPFTSIQTLFIDDNKYPLFLVFLTQEKFKNLKALWLYDCKIGPKGCKSIVEASLDNIQQINLGQNPLKNLGYMHLASGKWPFLRTLKLANCAVGNEGIQLLSQSHWPNLNYLNIGVMNMLRSEIPTSIRIHSKGLKFIKQIPWKSLRWLNLKGNPIGNKGCKIIKESGMVLQGLYLYECHFDEIGVKWLCKRDSKRLVTLDIGKNNFGNKGCYYLSKAIFPILKSLCLHENKIGLKGLKWLFKTDLVAVVMEQTLWSDELNNQLDNVYDGVYYGRIFAKSA